MKKLLYILPIILCVSLFSTSSIAQSSIANTGVAKDMLTVRPSSQCWECSLVEGVYTYTFNFVFKMYDVLRPIVYDVVLVFLAFWFLWLIWAKVIKKQDGDVYSLLKTIFIKILAITFVWAMLLRVSPSELFSYTIDPIMNLGTGFAKWILVETRNDNEIMQNNKLPKFDCSDITLSQKTKDMLKNNSVSEDSGTTETIQNLICLTREYSNTYNIGLSLGFKIASRGFKGLALNWGAKNIAENARTIASFIPHKVASIIVSAVIIIFQILLFFGYIVNFLFVISGLGIAIAFLYVALTFICLVLDIVIKLALIGVMMPITIGAWAFNDNYYMDLRSSLSKKLFGGVLKCACRITFLSIAISISIFLLTELMTIKFNVPNPTSIQDLYTSLTSDQSLGQSALQVIGLSSNSINLLKMYLNPAMVVAILLSTMLSWLLLTGSISMADKICGSLPFYSGVGDDTIFNGLKNLTVSSIKFITGGASREVLGFRKYEGIQKSLSDKVAKDVAEQQQSERKSKVEKWESDVFEHGDLTHLYDLPSEIIVDRFEQTQNPPAVFPQPREFYDNPENASLSPYRIEKMEKIQKTNDEIALITKPQQQFIDDKFANIDEYKNLPQDKKEKLRSTLFETGPTSNEKIMEIAGDSDISKLLNVVQQDSDTIFPMTSNNTDETYATPLHQMKDEYVKQEVLNMIAEDATSPEKIAKTQSERSALLK